MKTIYQLLTLVLCILGLAHHANATSPAEVRMHVLIIAGETSAAKKLFMKENPDASAENMRAFVRTTQERHRENPDHFSSPEHTKAKNDFVMEWVKKGQRIQAIKAYRSVFAPIGLRDAKEAVDRMSDEYKGITVPTEQKAERVVESSEKPRERQGRAFSVQNAEAGAVKLMRGGKEIKKGSKEWDKLFNAPANDIEISILEGKAKQGDSSAQLSLGRIYLGKRGNPVDHRKARKYLKMAADRGSGQAREELRALDAVK